MAVLERLGRMYGEPTTTNKFNRLRLNHAEVSEGLKGFEVSKGRIRFTTEKHLPTTLVKKLVKARIVENNAPTKVK